MIYFYRGNTLRCLTDKILSAIPQDGKEHVVIVPDRFTLSIERKLAVRGALLNVEVLPFSRFARRVLGAKARDCLTPEGCTMLLSKAIDRCRSRLQYYRGALDSEGFVNEMYSALVAVRNSGVDSARLRTAAETMHGRMADKTRDIATMLDAYREELNPVGVGLAGDGGKPSHTDPTTLLEALAEAIPNNPAIRNTSFYFVDFYCFNKVQYKVIGELMDYADNVHIGYIADNVGIDNRRIYPSDLADTLHDLARQKGRSVELVSVYEPLPLAKQAIQDFIFSYGEGRKTPLPEEEKGTVKTFFEPTLREELQTVCAEICKLMREKKYRYRDFAIVSADPDSIGDVLEEVFDDYQIPVFRDRKVLLSNEPLVRYILDGIAVNKDWEWDKVMTFVKNPLFDATSAELDEFENYCRRFAINYTRFTSKFELEDPRSGVDLATAEKVRARLVASVLCVDDCKTVHDYVEAILNYEKEQGLSDRFGAFCRRQMDTVSSGSLGRMRASEVGVQRSKQVPAKWNELLNSFDRLLGDETADVERFLRLFRSALQSVKISLLPSSLDQVYIGEAKDSHYDGVKVMFVVDAVEGKLPQVPEAGSILSDAYYRALQLGDVVVYPSVKDQGRYSRFYLEQLLLMPDYLYVSYASSDLAANPQVASTAYNFLHDMINLKDDAEKTAEDAKEKEEGKPGLGHTLIEQVSNHANAYKVLLRTHGTKDDEKDAEDEDRIGQHSEEYVRMESKEAALQSILTEEDKEHWARLYETPEEGLKEKGLFFRGKHVSVSELETYFKCPYNFFVKYGLHATERKEAGVDPDETGSVIHRVLELLFKDIDIDQVTESDLKKHIETCVKTAISESRLGSLQDKTEFKSRVNRLKSEACYVANTEFALVKQSKFRPLGTEIKINGKKDGDKDGKDEIKLSDLPLKGSIDRVDACVDGDETLVAVIDYKTGNHLEDRLHDVFYGHKIQPYAYLYSLAKAGYKPVAAFYKKANGHFRETTDKMPPFAMHGQVVSDPHILKLFEPDLDSKPHGELIPVEMSPSGDVSSLRGAPDLLVPKELFQDVIDYTWALMDNAVKEIDGGYIDANPNEDGCRYCKAYGMCPQGKKTPKRKTSRTVSLGYFFNPDAHEMAENGKEEETK